MSEVPATALPLQGLRVVEVAHMVMGPACGLMLADLGAEVVKVEPAGAGDNTRRLTGSGTGFFAAYNRNKKSLAVDVKRPEGLAAVRRLVATADVFVENFRLGAMDEAGLGYDALSTLNPRLVYVSLKGFLDGPYMHRTALDEVVQMMAGLAYMTGPPGQPLRAGASVNDVMGGMFGAIGALAALHRRDQTGKGEHVTSGLFETCAFLVGQHMAQAAIGGQPLQPMSVRTPAWGIYDVFGTADGAQVFASAVTDQQWRAFCKAFALDAMGSDSGLATNAQRVAARATLIPELQRRLRAFDKPTLLERLEAAGLPFAEVNSPEALFEDPHLLASAGLVEVAVAENIRASLPALPLALGGRRPGLRHDTPTIGGDGAEVLRGLGYDDDAVGALIEDGVVTVSTRRR